jgi:ribonuclease PH
MHIPTISNTSDQAVTASSLAMTNFGIPLAGSMSAGFTIGFIKG